MVQLTVIPERRENRASWVWSRVTEIVPIARLIGIAILILASFTVLAGLIPGALNPGLISLVLFLATLAILLVLGCWLVLVPDHAQLALVAALTLGPVCWTMMIFTWNDGGLVITPVALIFTGACTAAFCNWQLLTLQVALDLGATFIYVASYSKTAPPVIFARVAGHAFAVVLFTLGVYLLVRRVERVRRELIARSTLDELTGLPNRRHLQTVAAGLLASGRRLEREIYVLAIDIDRFSLVNQVHGPERGDEVINAFGKITRAFLRPEDLLLRMGDDEFLAAGLVRSQFEATRIAERLRQAIRHDAQVEVTCSIGVATARPGDGIDPVEWMWNLTAVAEESLAAAKASGRNRVAPSRQDGQVLGDALEVITPAATGGANEVPATQPSTTPVAWATPESIARVCGVLALVGVIFIIAMLSGSKISWSVPMVVTLVASLAYVFISAALVVRPRWYVSLMPIIIFAADLIWAGSCLLVDSPDQFIAPMPALIMCGFAAWLFTWPWFMAQLAVTFPLMYVVFRSAGQSHVVSLLDGALQAVAVSIAALGLYLMRRNSEDVLAESARTATTDQLTGLPNRRLLMERAPAIVAGAARAGVPVTVAYFDVDDFWSINERFGFGEGDRVLASIGRTLYRHSRAEDTVVRFGGDNFVLVTIGDPQEARLLADRETEALSELSLGEITVRARFSLATAQPNSGDDPQSWLLALIELAAEQLSAADEATPVLV